MREDFLLLNPGPVPVTREVRRAMDAPMISHRSAEFEALHERSAEFEALHERSAEFEALHGRARDGPDDVFERSTPSSGRERISRVRSPDGYGKRWSP